VDEPTETRAEDEWLTVKEVAAELRLTPATIRSWISTGTLRARRVGQRKLFVQRSEVNRLLTGEDQYDPDKPGPGDYRSPDVILAPHQSPHWSPESLEHVGRGSWLRFVDNYWQATLYDSDYAAPDPWFIDRLLEIAQSAARKAAAFANLGGEDPGDWWHQQDGLRGGVLSRELAPDANRPGSAALWTRFDNAVSTLDEVMRQHNLTKEQAALERLSLVAHDIAEELSQLGYPWPPSPPRPGAPFAPRRAMPSLAERLGANP
jgi:excisionase family DNA binding protein